MAMERCPIQSAVLDMLKMKARQDVVSLSRLWCQSYNTEKHTYQPTPCAEPDIVETTLDCMANAQYYSM